jgi:hypothetical protein
MAIPLIERLLDEAVAKHAHASERFPDAKPDSRRRGRIDAIRASSVRSIVSVSS